MLGNLFRLLARFQLTISVELSIQRSSIQLGIMNNLDKPILRVLRGENLNPPPVWLMRQAGRYLPEYRTLRKQAKDFLSLCYNSELASEVTLQPIRRFGFDGAILFADILLLPHALGTNVRFIEGIGPRLTPIQTQQQFNNLKPPDEIHEVLEPVYETINRVLANLPPQVTLIGFAGSPWTVATYLIAGRGENGQVTSKKFMLQEPELFGQIISLLTKATIEYLSRQIVAGVEVIKLFDSWAGSLEGQYFDKFITSPNLHIITELKKKHPGIPVIAFPKGAGMKLSGFATSLGLDGLALDQDYDLANVANIIPSVNSIQGNLNPHVLHKGGKNLETITMNILNACYDVPHIFNLGHGILPTTPIQNVVEMLEQIRGS